MTVQQPKRGNYIAKKPSLIKSLNIVFLTYEKAHRYNTPVRYDSHLQLAAGEQLLSCHEVTVKSQGRPSA